MKKIFFRSKLAIFILVITAYAYQANAQTDTIDTKGLKDHYRDFFPIGVAISTKLIADPDQRQLILKHFNSVTPENAMKMQTIHPEENTYNWKDADAIIDFATQNGLKIRGHTLCWYNQTPKWIFYDKDGKLVSKALLLERLKAHIYAVVKRYKGKVYAWDVVNEAISDNPKEFLRNSEWYQICGEDFISKAFQFAHEADPKAILFYNDYNTELPYKREKILRLLKSLISAGVPVQAVGLQGHWSLNNPSSKMLSESIQQYAALGIKVQVTELDMSIYPEGNTSGKMEINKSSSFSPAVQQLQAEQYDKIFKTLRQLKTMVSGVTFWNLSDRYSWLDNFPVRGRKNYPLLFDENLKPKKAYWNVVTF